MKGHRWRIQRVFVAPGNQDDGDRLRGLLDQGWEPFAVTNSTPLGTEMVYHLRREVYIEVPKESDDH